MNTIFVKNSRERKKEYQITTSVIEDSKGREVLKCPLNEAAKKHVVNIRDNYFLLRKSYNHLNLAFSQMKNEILHMEYIEGNTLENLMVNCLIDGEKNKFLSYLDEFTDFLRGMEVESSGRFSPSLEMESIFGASDLIPCKGLQMIANIDMTFGNIIINNIGIKTVIDYEWVFSFPIPTNYILYRTVHQFFGKNKDYFSSVSSLEDLLTYLGITDEELAVYISWGRSFHNYVYGQSYLYKYSKQVQTLAEKQWSGGSLNEGIPSSQFMEKYIRLLMRTFAKDRPIYIWGTGAGGKQTYMFFEQLGTPIEGFLDNNSTKWKSMFEGKEVQSPSILDNKSPDSTAPYIIIGSSYHQEIASQLHLLGFEEERDYYNVQFQ